MNLNSIECAALLQNTGFGSCYFTPGFFKSFARVGSNFKITPEIAASPETLKAYLLEQASLDDRSQRMYPVHGVKSITNNSEATVVQTFGDGSQVTVRQGYYNFKLQYTDGGFCLHKALLSWNGTGGEYIFWDQNGVLMGSIASDAAGNRYIKGIPLTYNEDPWGLNDGSNVAAFMASFSIDPSYLNENLGFIKMGFSQNELKGLQTLVLAQGTVAPAAGVIRVKASAGCDYSNVYDQFGADLAVVGLWSAKNDLTKAAITITSVTADAPNKQFVVTLDSTDSDYPATAAAKVDITLVGPTALAAADITGFEANTLVIARG